MIDGRSAQIYCGEERDIYLFDLTSGKSMGADQARINADIFPVVKLCLQLSLCSVTDATISVRTPFMISRSRGSLSGVKTTGTRWTISILPPTFDDPLNLRYRINFGKNWID